MLVTTLAPITFPYFEKISFKSLALVIDDKPDIHKFLLDDEVFGLELSAEDSANFHSIRSS